MLLYPGSMTLASTRPPVKQNLFHVEIMPPVKFRLWFFFLDSVISRAPLRVVTAEGSSHSLLFVCQ